MSDCGFGQPVNLEANMTLADAMHACENNTNLFSDSFFAVLDQKLGLYVYSSYGSGSVMRSFFTRIFKTDFANLQFEFTLWFNREKDLKAMTAIVGNEFYDSRMQLTLNSSAKEFDDTSVTLQEIIDFMIDNMLKIYGDLLVKFGVESQTAKATAKVRILG